MKSATVISCGSRMSQDVRRRTWDKAAFARRAQEKRKNEKLNEKERAHAKRSKGAGGTAGEDGSQLAWLEKRDFVPQFEHRVGETRFVSSANDQSTGFRCETCDVLLKDSKAYMTHINGKQHQKNLGMSMHVQRDTVSSVLDAIHEVTGRSCEAASPKKDVTPPAEHRNDSRDEHSEAGDEEHLADLGLPVSFGSSQR